MNATRIDPVARAAANHGDAMALIDRESESGWSFLALERRTRAVAAELFARDVRFGQTVATYLPVTAGHVCLLLALWRMGCAAVPLNPRLPPTVTREWAARAGADLLLETLPGDRDPGRGFMDLGADFSAPASVVFTSGSSGQSKAVVHNLTAHFVSAQASRARLPLAPGHRWLLGLPLCHVSGLSILFRCLATGAAIVVPRREESLAREAREAEATHLSVVAPQLAELLEPGVVFPALRVVLAGGGPVPEHLIRRAVERGLPLHLTYGMSEAASQICTTPRLTAMPEDAHCGRPLPGIAVRVSETGGIGFRGGPLMLGYLEDGGRLVSPVDEDGWFDTGDLGGWDEDGNLRVRGRADRMFVSGGENIQPETIEEALEALAGVERAVVVPLNDARFGKRPCAFVTPFDPDRSAALAGALRERLPGFMIPVAFHPWPEEVDSSRAKIPLEVFRRRLVELSGGLSGAVETET